MTPPRRSHSAHQSKHSIWLRETNGEKRERTIHEKEKKDTHLHVRKVVEMENRSPSAAVSATHHQDANGGSPQKGREEGE